MQPVVGIFSRDCDSSYRFLRDFLRTRGLEVRSFTITNNGFQRFLEEASSCHFAILYHTNNRGRLNITDVIDSLYDEEIEELNRTLGKNNVIVVADDLKENSSKVKMRFLDDQPSIQQKASGLFLFSQEDKNSEDLLNEKLQKILSHIRATRTIERNVREPEPNNAIMGSPGAAVTIFDSLWTILVIIVQDPGRSMKIIREKIIQNAKDPVTSMKIIVHKTIQYAKGPSTILCDLNDIIRTLRNEEKDENTMTPDRAPVSIHR